ncbi:TetR/AcrR family transcriptional regulator [Flavisolibacter ginsengisoli]|jgi:AcrR family transcriptional regulator|uniref:Transcriptional regulator, TetR family n=1 Tax=Flavisolibacter ginsengisoli DSM 18119 TaxID=1121884 RepID=A0A1M4YG75_9BACT|nr:TetR/AcrR family transcriptional regulator [Flavisolibacter ginsengisoli]SHF04466.1 transcriptional regulator, TetR family [Flavisolibacter ginsengisoli DSM 18119]
MVNTRDRSTEEKILAAARKIFLNKGMDGARMQDIADEAGINKALLHYYFRSKDKLFEQIFLEVASSMLPRIFSIFQSDDTLFTKIEKFCDTYITQEIKTPYVPIFILNEVNRQPQAFLKKVLGNTRPPVEKLLQQIEQETKAGLIKPIDPLQLLLNTLSLCIFPFLASPMIQLLTGMEAKNFRALMEERKKLVPQLIIESIKN